MATITFHCNAATNVPAGADAVHLDPTLIHNEKGSGLGFFGAGFGLSVPVGEWQSQTYVTNANGTSSGIECANTRFGDAAANAANMPNSGMFVSTDGLVIGNSGLPNHMAPLNIRFTHESDEEGVRVQNCKLRIFDRNNINQHASGVFTKVYEVRRPNPIKNSFAANQGPLKLRGYAGDHEWKSWNDGTDSSVADMILTSSPGSSGLNTSGDDLIGENDGTYTNWTSNDGEGHRSTQHDWYLAISASPTEIGSKTDYGMYFTVEYL